MAEDGQLCIVLPQPGYWKRHGIPSGFPGVYYPYLEWYEEFANLNNYKIKDIWTNEEKHLNCCRMQKLKHTIFSMPSSGMYKNGRE